MKTCWEVITLYNTDIRKDDYFNDIEQREEALILWANRMVQIHKGGLFQICGLFSVHRIKQAQNKRNPMRTILRSILPSSILVTPSKAMWVCFIKQVQECSQWACLICIMCSCTTCTGSMGLSPYSSHLTCNYNCLWQINKRAFISLIRARHALVGYHALVSRTNARWLNLTTLGLYPHSFGQVSSVSIRPVL